jgi:hypothetical protein
VNTVLAETWNEQSEHGYWHQGEARVYPSSEEVIDRPIVGKRAAFWLRWEPRSIREFLEDMDFGLDEDFQDSG